MSIRWKLQIGFFMVTMVTIIINRWAGYGELEQLTKIARDNHVSAEVLSQLDARLGAYITASIWQSALEFVVLFILIGILANMFVAPIKALCHALEGIEAGNLTTKVENRSQDEIGILERSFNAMLANLTSVIRNIDENSKQMAQSSYQVATISHEIAEINRSEHNHSSEVSAATEELRHISESVLQLAEDAHHRAKATEECAREGVRTVQDNIAVMGHTVEEVNIASRQVADLKDAAQKIYDIIASIHGIAEQTNLLALNAAIEAARAGDQGRGFAVVADEVRSLANRTSASTNEITNIINQVNQQVEAVAITMSQVVSTVNNSQEKARATSGVIERMAEEVTATADSNSKISEVSSHQSTHYQLLQQRLDGLFATFQLSSEKVENTAVIGEDLYKVSESMKKLLAGFTFDRNTQIRRDANDKRKMPRVTAPLRIQITQNGRMHESICADFSMTGLKLRINEKLDSNTPLELKIFRPYDKLDMYEKQNPHPFYGRIRWQRKEGGHNYCGVEFQNLNDAQRGLLKKCFEYFEKRPEYGT